MIRTQIQLEEVQYRSIREMAHSRNLSMAEVIRRLLRVGMASGLPEEEAGGPRYARALLEVAGVADSGLGDLGVNHDEYLARDVSHKQAGEG